jgi:hypothetical protein
MEGRYRHLIIVNRKREFAELCEGRYTVGEDGDPTPALRQHRRIKRWSNHRINPSCHLEDAG